MHESVTFPGGRSPAAQARWLILHLSVGGGLLAAATGLALTLPAASRGGFDRLEFRLLLLTVVLAVAAALYLVEVAKQVRRRARGDEVRGATRLGLTVGRAGFKDMTSQKRGTVPWHHVARWRVERGELHVQLRHGKPSRVIRLSGLRAPASEVAEAFETYSRMPPSGGAGGRAGRR
ncbi:hypothetical protein [Isoptericola sp. NPDC057559]|uniref:hypothetical protein n=1 Tax=Isoptericola sp. NPDC057559 TaxID=3346168 RepID=UPI0036C23F06